MSQSCSNEVSVQFSSVAQSCLTLCNPMNGNTPGLPPCPSPTPRVHPNPCPLSRWCHPTISSFVVSFSCPQSFPASASFQMSDLTSLHFLLRGQNFPLLPNQQQQKRLPFNTTPKRLMTFSGGSVVKESTCQARNMGSISGSGRSLGGGHGNPLQYSCLGIPMDKEAWWTTVHGVRQDWGATPPPLK